MSRVNPSASEVSEHAERESGAPIFFEGADYVIRARQPYPDLAVLEGDHVFVHQQASAEPDQVVVVVVDRCATVQRWDGSSRVLGLVVGVMGRRG